jgi:hypothetical protein
MGVESTMISKKSIGLANWQTSSRTGGAGGGQCVSVAVVRHRPPVGDAEVAEHRRSCLVCQVRKD